SDRGLDRIRAPGRFVQVALPACERALGNDLRFRGSLGNEIENRHGEDEPKNEWQVTHRNTPVPGNRITGGKRTPDTESGVRSRTTLNAIRSFEFQPLKERSNPLGLMVLGRPVFRRWRARCSPFLRKSLVRTARRERSSLTIETSLGTDCEG